jgi:hypothetical protein
MKKIKSPSNEIRAPCLESGITSIAQIMLARVMAGATWNIKPEDLLKTLPFINKTLISLIGCNIPGPFRPENMLFVRRIIPGKKIAAINININPTISDKIQVT